MAFRQPKAAALRDRMNGLQVVHTVVGREYILLAAIFRQPYDLIFDPLGREGSNPGRIKPYVGGVVNEASTVLKHAADFQQPSLRIFQVLHYHVGGNQVERSIAEGEVIKITG